MQTQEAKGSKSVATLRQSLCSFAAALRLSSGTALMIFGFIGMCVGPRVPPCIWVGTISVCPDFSLGHRSTNLRSSWAVFCSALCSRTTVLPNQSLWVCVSTGNQRHSHPLDMGPVVVQCVRDSDHLHSHTVHRPLLSVSSCTLPSQCVRSLTAVGSTHRVVAHSQSQFGTAIRHRCLLPTAQHDVSRWQFHSHRCISIAQNGFGVW